MLTLTCEICKATFTAKIKRRCCCRSCSSKLGSRNSGHLPWQPEETHILESLLTVQPLEVILKRIQQLDRRRGWPIRTRASLYTKSLDFSPTVRPILDNWPMQELANILGVDHERARLWTRWSNLKYTKRAGGFFSIKRADFIEWAYQNPEKLAGIDAERLDYVLEDYDFCERVSKLPYIGTGIARKVKNLTTGQVFKSAREAARQSHLSKWCVNGAIKRGGKAGGDYWEYVD